MRRLSLSFLVVLLSVSPQLFARGIVEESAAFSNNRGLEYHNNGEYDRAIEYFSRAISLNPKDANLYINRGDAYNGKNEYDLAIGDYKEALIAAENSADINDIFAITMNYANRIYGRYPFLDMESDPFMESLINLTMDGISRSVKQAEQVRPDPGAPVSDIMKAALCFYYMGVDLEANFGSPEKVFEYSESLRNHVSASLAQAREWLDEDTAVLIYALWDESIDFNPIGVGYSADFPRPAINSYCLVLTSDGLAAVCLNPELDYIQAINNMRNQINAANRTRRLALLETYRNDLYNALIKPALPHIPEHIQNLIIVPDGTLGFLPFDILREDSDSPDLGETYRLSLSLSVSASMLREEPSPQNLPILAFGGASYEPDRTDQRPDIYENDPNRILWRDLPGTEVEVRMLEQLVPSAADIRVFVGSDVSEAQIKRFSAEGELKKYPILHFATNSYFREEDLERAGLVLSEVSGLLDNGEDGYLTIPEIAALDLNARLVMLSGCDTGLGVLFRGDGMVSMYSAFLLAGSHYVGVGLWEISDDATVEFMTRFYGKVLNEGKTFREAFYLVKNEFRQHDRWSHPYYWSAFVLYE